MKGKFYIYTLGCRVNSYESRAIAEEFLNAGCTPAQTPEEADYKIVNTCAVTGESERKSMQMIRRAASAGSGKTYVVGCCKVPENKRVEGVFYAGKSMRKGGLSLLTGTEAELKPLDGFEKLTVGEYHDAERTRAFVKIEDGCPNKCSYCIIPSLRGGVTLRDRESILTEARRIASLGTKEIVLTGIEISAYPDLAPLVAAVAGTEGIERIRLGSLDPRVLTDAFLSAVSAVPQFMHHLHISLQSGSSRVLALMKRPYNAEQAKALLEKTVSYMPDVLFSADIITGFPTETPEEAEMTAEFLENFPFVHIHAFPFSPRRGTEAALMPDMPMSEKRRRCKALIAKSDSHRARILGSLVGTATEVLVEKQTGGICTGLSKGYVETRFASRAEAGDIVKIKVTGTDGYVLTGEEA